MIVLVIGAFLAFDLGRYLDLQTLKEQQAVIETFRANRPLLSIALYFIVYVVVTALSFPGAPHLTLAGGAIFGYFWGTLIASFASTFGATLAWLAASGLALARDDFLAVVDGQQNPSRPEVFAAGDEASRIVAPHAKSGVYAVRAGLMLTANLERTLLGIPPLSYRPQQRSVYLLASGPREAMISWGGVTASGRWASKWKEWIDRYFMRQYDPSAGQN